MIRSLRGWCLRDIEWVSREGYVMNGAGCCMPFVLLKGLTSKMLPDKQKAISIIAVAVLIKLIAGRCSERMKHLAYKTWK